MNGTLLLLLMAATVVTGLVLASRGKGPSRPSDRAPESPDGAEDRSASALREIDFDRLTGKLSEADYRALRARYEPAPAPPVAVTGGPPPAAAAFPTAVHEPRSPMAGDAGESLVRRMRETTVTCTVCGVRPEPDARYCSNCGRFLEPCTACGRAVSELGARFCSVCGAGLGP